MQTSLVLQASLLPKKGSQHSKSGGHSKTLRIVNLLSRSIFSTVGFFEIVDLNKPALKTPLNITTNIRNDPAVLRIRRDSKLTTHITQWFTISQTRWTSLAFYRGQKGPSLENSEKNLKRGKNSKKSRKLLFFKFFFRVFDSFSTLFRLFSCFFDPGAERPREPLFRLFFGVF